MELKQHISKQKLTQPKFLWAYALAISVIVDVLGAFRGAYVSGDYPLFLERLIQPAKIFDFSWVHPPLYFLMGNSLYWLIGRNNGFPITLSIIQTLINAIALWWFFVYTESRFKSRTLHLAFVLFLTFLPVRIIHAASVGTDWMTIPVFVLLLFLFDKFLTEPSANLKNSALLGLGLALGVWCKYSFVALLPAFLLIFIVLWVKRGWSFKQFTAVCMLSLALSSGLVLFSFWASARADSFGTKIWLPKEGAPGQPDMGYADLFSVKVSDLELFAAPEMFKWEPEDGPNYHVGFRAPHKHSYLALAHLGIFTDIMNVFQILPRPQDIGAHLIPDFKTRAPWKTRVMQGAMILGVLWTVLALIATLWALFAAAKNLYAGSLEREDVVALLGSAYFLLLFLPIPFVYHGALNAYWMPRLILVSLLFFFLAAFRFVDTKIAPKWEKIPFVILSLVIVQSALAIVMLI